MQIKQEQLKRQQLIMAHLGFYHHKIDGIWGPESIAAKSRWEMDKTFIPGNPNGGLPLSDSGPFPRNVTLDKSTRLLQYSGLTAQMMNDLLSNRSPAPAPVIMTPAPAKTEEMPAEPVQSAPIQEPTPESTKAEEKQESEHSGFKKLEQKAKR